MKRNFKSAMQLVPLEFTYKLCYLKFKRIILMGTESKLQISNPSATINYVVK